MFSTPPKAPSENQALEVPAKPGNRKSVMAKISRFLSRIWFSVASSRFIQKFRTLLRNLSFGIITFLRGDKDEPPKVLINSSIRLAMARCAIHIVPAFLSIALVTLNCIGFFIGNELQGPKGQDDLKMGLLQIAAKIQELLIVGSVGSVIFHVLRSELIFGDGMPLGLLVSGFSFSQVSYFWSAEFLGGLCCTNNMTFTQRWKRRGFVLLVLIGGALALLAGPAAALLMIPRELEWPVGGGVYWLNGSDEQPWPTYLDAGYYSEVNCNIEGGQFTDNKCPSQGFMAMHQHFLSWWNSYNTGYSFELKDDFIRKTMYARPALLADANTWAFTAHAATARLQDAMRGIHLNALRYLARTSPDRRPFPGRLVWADPMRYEVDTKVPAARVFCELQGILDLEGTSLTVKFPNIKGIDDFWTDTTQPLIREVHGAEVLDEVEVLGDVQRALAARGILNDTNSRLNPSIFDQRRDALIVPTDIWNSTNNSLGLVVLLKDLFNRTNSSPEISPPSNAIACSIDARWAKGKTIMEMTINTPLDHKFVVGRVLNFVETELEFQGLLGYVRVRPPANSSMRPIRLAPDWYDMLSPTLPDKAPNELFWLPITGSKRTTLETLLSTKSDPNNSRQTEFENLIATVFVDGISRSGLIPNLGGSRFLEPLPWGGFRPEHESLARKLLHQGDPVEVLSEPEILKSGNRMRLEMKAIYKGHVMTIEGWFDWLSVIGLLLHAVIAIAHTFLMVIMRKTGGTWDSILELIALTQRSAPPPPSLLENTSAWIRSFKTVRLMAWVEVPKAGETTALEDKSVPGGGLQMRFRDLLERRDERLKPAVDKVYGVSEEGYRPLFSRNTP
ncbi:hypothetical protein FSARC_5978 [Fusarium sarcochroum]|uniref:Uncharacterized protein n=1 Tax=Fusarium sarcochroum TaxID=1208366 RepID=A0A8H4X9L2_9HYPO|nr:hypothetical protein FSARC_5978 [Fusarium sarcochroum]